MRQTITRQRAALHVVTTQQRQALCQTKVTLNGEPAVISGWSNAFAKVTQIRSGLGCEWAWPTVAHIVTNKDGAFQS